MSAAPLARLEIRLKFWYALPILLFIALVQAGAMSKPMQIIKADASGNSSFSHAAKPGEALIITFKSAEDEYFNEVQVQSVEQCCRGLSKEELDYCMEQDWITDGVVISASAFRRLDSPLVYVFLRDSLPLYVGMSKYGISRPKSKRHGASGARDQSDEVRLYFCRDAKHAHVLEAYLISKFQPPYNGTGVYE